MLSVKTVIELLLSPTTSCSLIFWGNWACLASESSLDPKSCLPANLEPFVWDRAIQQIKVICRSTLISFSFVTDCYTVAVTKGKESAQLKLLKSDQHFAVLRKKAED